MKPATPAPYAIAAIKAGPPAAPPDKALRITRKVRQAIELLATGNAKTQLEAAEQVGLTRETISRALAKPHVIEHLRQRAIRTIAMAAGRAAEVKAELLDCADNMVRDRASSFVLGTAGIGPETAPALNINLEMRAGYVIDLSSNGYRERVAATAAAPADHHPLVIDLDQDSAE